jgi:hypothetical protein
VLEAVAQCPRADPQGGTDIGKGDRLRQFRFHEVDGLIHDIGASRGVWQPYVRLRAGSEYFQQSIQHAILQRMAAPCVVEHFRGCRQLLYELDHAALELAHDLCIRARGDRGSIVSEEFSSRDPRRVPVEKVFIDCNEGELESAAAAHPIHCIPPVRHQDVRREGAAIVVKITTGRKKSEEYARASPRSATVAERPVYPLVNHLNRA